MTAKNTKDQKCPYDDANLFSKITFWWVNSLIKNGFSRGLTLDDVSRCPQQDKSDYLLQRIDKSWEQHLSSYKSGNGASLFRAVISAFKTEFILPGVIMFLCETCRVIQPLIIGQLILYFQDNTGTSRREAYIYAVILGLLLSCAVLCDVFHFFSQQHLSLKMKTAVGALIYKKIINLNTQTFHLTNSGKIVNLLTTDLEKFNYAFDTSHFLWICPIQLVAVLVLLYQYVGFPSLFTLIVIVTLLPIQVLCGRMFANLRHKVGRWSDQRINKMNEILSGIIVIKMYCWEKPFHNVIRNLRRQEVKFVKHSMCLRALNLCLREVSPKLMGLIIFVSMWWLGRTISVQLVFVTVGWMLVLQDSVFLFQFLAIENSMALYASLQRVQSFLLIGEKKSTRTFKNIIRKPVINNTGLSVEIERMTARWNINLDDNEIRYSKMEEREELLLENDVKYFCLRNISLTVKQGELIAVVGKVGAGKTSLLMTLMGEIQHNKGQITVYGSVSYSCQHSWVFSGSVKDNILLGEDFCEEKYQQVLQSCALVKDVNHMFNGDSTLVGERGLFLSGGQKARLTLARAVYRDCDIYLLDDPLSSVDSEVGQHIFHHCINGMLRSKTRILVTHQLQYLTLADRILVLDEGKVCQVGTYDELLENGVDFANLIEEECEDNGAVKDVDIVDKTEWKDDILSIKEDLSLDRVPFNVYKSYFKAGDGYIIGPILLLVILLYKPAYFLADWNLARWAQSFDNSRTVIPNMTDSLTYNATESIIDYNLYNQTENITMWIGTIVNNRTLTKEMKLYFLFTAVFSVFGFLSVLINMQIFARASQNLHNKMFKQVLGATSRFFNSQPLGRIINRFSRDIGIMDDFLILVTDVNLSLFLSLMGTAINICVIAPWLFLALVPLCIVIIAIRCYAIRTIRDIKRLEALAKSPVYCHVSDTIIGLQTIRVNGKGAQFAEEFNGFQNAASGAWFMYLSANRWFSLRSLLCVIVFINTVIHVCLLMKDHVSSELLALALTYLTSFATPFEFFIRMTAELENNMTAVERILSYTTVKQEACKTSDRPPPTDWPSQGSITFSDVNLKYDLKSPTVLKNINLHIRSKEKIGIVGRTGAGKSSLLAALFRLTEPEGKIWIDGWNILQIGLDELRRKISVIPQDPVLFSGTLRYNLDPFDEYSDERLWNALEQVQLRDKVAETPDNLYMEMSESGHNFSLGERQLVCLARALLRYNTILVLDEATAHVDNKTDELIQGTLRAKFIDSTVLTIAHRLHTVMDCDRIIVLCDGEVKEFDTPYNLLQDEDGFFTNLVEQTGQQQAAVLHHMAKLANEGRASASFLLEKAVQKADRHLSNSRCSLDKSMHSRSSLGPKELHQKSQSDVDKQDVFSDTDTVRSKTSTNHSKDKSFEEITPKLQQTESTNLSSKYKNNTDSEGNQNVRDEKMKVDDIGTSKEKVIMV